MRIAEIGIRQSLLVNLFTVFVIVVGISTVLRMNREAFPNVSFDVVTVQTHFPGAPPADVEKHVTIPIEKELKEVDDLEEITSVSAENLSIIIIELDPDTRNKDRVINDIQRAVDRVDDLPEDADDSLVIEARTSDAPIVEISLSGDFSERDLRNHARILRDRLEEIPHVSKVDRSGWREREISIEVDSQKLRDWHISFDEVIAAVRSRNLNLPGGTLKTPTGEYLIRTMGEFESAKDVESVIIRGNDQGNWIRVSDVAQVLDTFEEEETIQRTDGHRAINLIVIKKRSGDTIKIVDQSREVIQLYLAANPQLSAVYVDDMSFYVKRRLNILKTNGLIGIALVVLVLVIFLSLPVAIMTAVGIPFALLLTLTIMHALGINLNLISMFGLIIVLGMVVDDAIIISENIYSHMERGKSVKQAAVDGTQEVLGPVTTTVLTTLCAFFALTLMTGIIGKYVREIPIVAMITLSVSLLEAAIILPCHIADFVRTPKKGPHGSPATPPGSHWFQAVSAFYTSLLTRALQRRVWVLIGVVLLIPTLFLAARVFGLKFVLFPQRGIEELHIRAKGPIGTELEKTETLFQGLEERVARLEKDELEHYVTTIGLQKEDSRGAAATRGSHLGQVHIYLTPQRERKRSTDEIINVLRQEMKGVPGFDEIVVDTRRSGPPVGKAVEVTLRGEDFEGLEALAALFKRELASMKGVVDIKDDHEKGKAELRVIVDTNAAKKAGLTTGQIASTVRFAFEGGVATTIKTGDVEEEIDVVVRYPEEERKSRDTFARLLISNTIGNLIPLHTVARIEESEGINYIKHMDGKRSITVSASVDEKSKTTSREANAKLMQAFKTLPPEFTNYTVKYGGEEERTAESMGSLFRAFWISAFLIFMILAALFRSILQPVIVMIAIPFAIMGVVLAFLLHGEPLNFMAILGTIGLAGVVVNDSIVLVSFINQRRREGLGTYDSIVDGCKSRLRPVLLTTLTTVAGLFPVAYGWGTTNPDPFVAPAALAISWGILFATGLTLIVIPCVFYTTDTVRERFLRLGNRVTA